jgi:hypothetical protein
MKNIQTGNDFTLQEFDGFLSFHIYHEQLSDGESIVTSSIDSSRDYFALFASPDTIVKSEGHACIDEALAALEGAIYDLIHEGSPDESLRLWHSPQRLGV